MSTAYEKNDKAVEAVLAEALRRFHHDLVEVDLKICTFKVYKFDKDDNPDHACKYHGHPANAIARRYGLKQRVQTGYDCEITVDGLTWDNLSAPARLALIDHELTHFALERDEGGQVMTDDIKRPKLSMRLDDFMLTGFLEVVERHGEHAGEAQTVKAAWAAVKDALAVALASAQGAAKAVDKAA